MKNKLILFDCDNTLWMCGDDYVSRIKSEYKLLDKDNAFRVADKKKFSLTPGTRQLLEELKTDNNFEVGIVSDNHRQPVKALLKLFDIWQFFNPSLVNVRLWDGYCDKGKMVKEILKDNQFSGVYWFDDKDYSKQAKEHKVKFIKVGKTENLWNLFTSFVASPKS